MDHPLLVLQGVSKTFGGASPVYALRDVNLVINRGELVGIVGPSGAGKSTLLNIIGALDTATEGEIWIEGTPLGRLSDRRLAGFRGQRIGFVFQQFHLLPSLSVRANVAMGLLYRGTSRKHRWSLADEALMKVGLTHRAQQLTARLSSGERQRTAIARALIGHPAIVLADEPTGNLDSAATASIVELLLELHRAGSTLLVITHDDTLARSFPRTIRIIDGRVSKSVAGISSPRAHRAVGHTADDL